MNLFYPRRKEKWLVVARDSTDRRAWTLKVRRQPPDQNKTCPYCGACGVRAYSLDIHDPRSWMSSGEYLGDFCSSACAVVSAQRKHLID